MAGYSKTPLAKKLGIKPGCEIFTVNEPDHYRKLLEPLPEAVSFTRRLTDDTALIHLFSLDRSELESTLPELRNTMAADAMIWVSWPKKASKVPTDITEDVIREVALPTGLVDIKVCAVDDIWSGLKLMIRKTLR